MQNALLRKLGNFTRFTAAERHLLQKVGQDHIRHRAAREDVIHEGDNPDHVNVILSGWACRYKTLEDGRRQILALFVPGDMCDLNVFILKAMDHSIAALTPITYAEVYRDTFLSLLSSQPRISQALWWDSLVNAAIQREWIVNLGRRTAFERLGHLLCEMFWRLRAVGLTTDNSCEIPMTQADLGDATGLSTVHVNRSLQELRGANLIVLRGKALTIPDLEALQIATLFNPNYLHLDQEGSRLDANEA